MVSKFFIISILTISIEVLLLTIQKIFKANLYHKVTMALFAQIKNLRLANFKTALYGN